MDKKIVEKVLERSGGGCEICGSFNGVQFHHMIGGGGKRKQCETEHSVILLCYNCHHIRWHGGDTDFINYHRRKLQQKYIDLGYSKDEIFYLMGGRNYL